MPKTRLLDRVIEEAVEIARERPEMREEDVFLSALVAGCTEYMLANGEHEDYWTRRVMGVIRATKAATAEEGV